MSQETTNLFVQFLISSQFLLVFPFFSQSRLFPQNKRPKRLRPIRSYISGFLKGQFFSSIVQLSLREGACCAILP